MKTILILAFAIWTTTTFGQIPINKTTEEVSKFDNPLQNDTSVIVATVIGPAKQSPKIAYFLNDQFLKYSLLVSINPKRISGLRVIEKAVKVDSVKYDRQIRLRTKNNYSPKAISLTNLVAKYYPNAIQREPLIFMIDGNIIHGDYDVYKIDENNLYAITMDSEFKNDKIKLRFVKLTTKSEANIKNFRYGNIWMRGDDVTLMK